MKNNLDTIYLKNKASLGLLGVFICGAYICHLTDQIFAYLYSIMFYLFSTNIVLSHLEKSKKDAEEDKEEDNEEDINK